MQQPKLYFDLTKAIDRSKLVQVQRTVTRKNGTTFQQNFWVNPSDVKSSDKVIGNQKVLDDYKDRQKKNAQQTNAALFKFDKNKYDQLKNDREKAMEYAEQCGVQFTKKDKDGKPLSEAIRWMRCQMAVSKLSNTAPTITVPTLSLNGVAQNFDTMTKKDKMAELLKNNSRKELMNFARRSGIAWSETDQQGNPLSEGIIWMRASIAIQKFIDGKSLLDLTNISGNVNAPTQQKTTQTPTPPPSDQMDIPVNATERQKNIINLLNKITDTADLELYKSMGMIAEDDDAKAFIKDKLKPRYDDWKKGHSPSSGNKRASTSDEFGTGLSDELNSTFKGIPKKTLKKVFSGFHRNFSIYGMLYPRMALRTSGQSNKLSADSAVADSDWSQENTVEGIIRLTTSFFSKYNTDGTKIINDSYDLDQCKKDYDPDKEGFLLVLNHIAKQDPDLKPECDRISGIYDTMLSKVGYNHELLRQVLTRTYDDDIAYDIKKYEDNQKKISTIVSIMRNKGYSDTQIQNTMDHNRYANWDNIRLFDEQDNPVRDSSGNPVRIDCTQEPQWDSNWGSCAYSQEMRDVQQFLKGEAFSDAAKIEAFKTITPQVWLEIRALECDMAGIEVFNNNTQTTVDLRDSTMKPKDWDNISRYHGYELKPKQGVEDVDYVLGNLYHILKSVAVKNDVAAFVPQDAPYSAANSQGSDWTGNFDYYQGLGGRHNHKLYSYSPQLTYDQMNSLTQEILDSEKVYSKKYMEDARKFADDNGDDQFNPTSNYWYTPPTDPRELKKIKVQSVGLRKGSSFKDINGTPGGDILQDLIQSIASYCPQMKTTRYSTPDKLRKHVDAVLGYTPTVFAPKSTATSPQQTPADVLRKLREDVFTHINCTLQTCDQKTTDYTQTRIKRGWDNGKLNASGTARLYGNITAEFTGKSYRVKNSAQMERMRAHAQRLSETPKDFFHGTGHSGAAGIVGVDGKFICSGTNGTMLGTGVYLAEDAGKSAGYFGRWGSGYNREGCMILCKAVLGKMFTTNTFQQAPAGYDTTYMKAGTNTGRTVLRADEWCVRNPDMVAPEYIVDMTVKNR